MAPSIGRIVHYVSYGTPGGEYTSQCRAAIVAGVPKGALPIADGEHAEAWWSATWSYSTRLASSSTGARRTRATPPILLVRPSGSPTPVAPGTGPSEWK